MKIRPVGAELFHAEGRKKRRTDVTKLIVAFRNFANAPKNIYRRIEKERMMESRRVHS